MGGIKKETYQTPYMAVIEVENEGVMANSSGSFIDGGNPLGNTGSNKSSTLNSSYNNSTSDLEDLINDILTIGQ